MPYFSRYCKPALKKLRRQKSTLQSILNSTKRLQRNVRLFAMRFGQPVSTPLWPKWMVGREQIKYSAAPRQSSIVTIAENRAPCIYDKMATAVFRLKQWISSG